MLNDFFLQQEDQSGERSPLVVESASQVRNLRVKQRTTNLSNVVLLRPRLKVPAVSPGSMSRVCLNEGEILSIKVGQIRESVTRYIEQRRH